MSDRRDLELARRACEAFGVDATLRCVATGIDSTYRARSRDGGTHVAVRIGGPSEERRPAALRMEAAWMDALADDLPIALARPRRLPDGGLVTVLDDDEGRRRGCFAVAWLTGTKMRWRFTVRHADALGAAAAHLHDHAAHRFDPPADGWAKTWTAEQIVGASSPTALEAITGADAMPIVDAVRSLVSAAEPALGPRILVNGDLGPHNVVWTSDGGAGLFDFNDLGWGHAALDLARLLGTLRWRDGGQALVDAAVRGYRTVAPLPTGWREHGELLEIAFRLRLASYLALRIDERGPEAERTVRRLVGDAKGFLDRAASSTTSRGAP